MTALEVVSGETELFEVVRSLCASRRLSNFLNGGKQKSNQDCDDGDDDKELDEREGGPSEWGSHGERPF